MSHSPDSSPFAEVDPDVSREPTDLDMDPDEERIPVDRERNIDRVDSHDSGPTPDGGVE